MITRSVAARLLVFYITSLAIVSAIMAVVVLGGGPDVVGALFAFLQERGLPTNLVSIGRFAVANPWGWLILGFAAAPTMAAVAASTALEGAAGIRRLAGRFRLRGQAASRRSALLAYAVIGGVSATVLAAYLWWGARVGDPAVVAASREALGGTAGPIAVALLVGHFVDEGGTLEELGWRGFALPALLERRTPLAASLALGALWWAWHLPREVPAVLIHGVTGPLLAGQAVFLATCVALSVLMTWGFLATGGSVWPAILIHGGSNVWSKALGATVNPWAGADVRAVIVIAAALPIAAAWIHREGGLWRRPDTPLPA